MVHSFRAGHTVGVSIDSSTFRVQTLPVLVLILPQPYSWMVRSSLALSFSLPWPIRPWASLPLLQILRQPTASRRARAWTLKSMLSVLRLPAVLASFGFISAGTSDVCLPPTKSVGGLSSVVS